MDTTDHELMLILTTIIRTLDRRTVMDMGITTHITIRPEVIRVIGILRATQIPIIGQDIHIIKITGKQYILADSNSN